MQAQLDASPTYQWLQTQPLWMWIPIGIVSFLLIIGMMVIPALILGGSPRKKKTVK